MWNIVIKKVSTDGLKTQLERETVTEEPDLDELEYWEKYYTTYHDPYAPQHQAWIATVISVFKTR